MSSYRKAPIVEAVIDLTFGEKLSTKDVERLRDKFKRTYPNVQERFEVHVRVEGTTATPNFTPDGFQLNATDGADAILVRPAGLTTIRLPPYSSWEIFSETARRNFEVYVDLLGRPKIQRIATRYINRVDIPNKMILGLPIEKFFRIGVSIPDEVVSEMSKFSASSTIIEKGTSHLAKVSCHSTEAALIDCQSFIIDIDVYKIGMEYGRVEEIWAVADELRLAKNNIFEAAITDDLRELFK